MEKQIDMTRGPILQKAALFALPICAGNILQQLYSTVDTLVIGNFCDKSALAAVATSAQPMEILLCVFLGIGSGVSILVSQQAGHKEGTDMQELARSAAWFLYACALPLTVLGILSAPWLLRIMQVPEDAFEEAVSYLHMTMLGCIGNLGYNLNSGILRGLGNSRSTLLFLIVTSLLNILLDLVFVAGFEMRAAGAALATAVSMILSWMLSLYYLRRHYPQAAPPVIPRGFDPAVLKQVLRVGLPLGMNTALYSVGHLFLQSLYNMQGSAFVAGCSVAGRLNSIANVTVAAFSSAAGVFSGQNLGAGQYIRLRKGMRQIPLFSGALSLTAGIVVTLFCRPLLSLFNQDAQVLEIGTRYILLVLPFYWIYAVYNGIMNFINGLGQIRYTTIVSFVLLWVVRIPIAYVFSWLGYGGYAMASLPLSFFAGMVAMLLYFKTSHWRKLCAEASREAHPGHHRRGKLVSAQTDHRRDLL